MNKYINFLFLITVVLTMFLNVQAQISLVPKRITNIQNAYPVLSSDGKKVVFESDRTGNWEIYTMNLDGSELKQLTNNTAADHVPVWSPDGKLIVFASERDKGDSEIYLMNADGSNQRNLSNQPGDDSHPHWSPDGTRIIFNSAQSTPDLKADWSKQFHEVFTMKVDGTDVKQISNLKTISTYPSFSPDGKKIVFRVVTSTPGFRWDLSKMTRNSEIFVMNADGTNPVNVSNHPAYDGWCVWSPDSTKILFSSNRAGPANMGQLFVMNADGTNVKKITDNSASFVQASWSRDGKKILSHQHWETREFGNIVIFDVKF